MKMLIGAALLSAVLSAALMSQVVRATEPPCERVLAELRASEQDQGPIASDAATFNRLEASGIDRCRADDDHGADALFRRAAALLRRVSIQ